MVPAWQTDRGRHTGTGRHRHRHTGTQAGRHTGTGRHRQAHRHRQADTDRQRLGGGQLFEWFIFAYGF